MGSRRRPIGAQQQDGTASPWGFPTEGSEEDPRSARYPLTPRRRTAQGLVDRRRESQDCSGTILVAGHPGRRRHASDLCGIDLWGLASGTQWEAAAALLRLMERDRELRCRRHGPRPCGDGRRGRTARDGLHSGYRSTIGGPSAGGPSPTRRAGNYRPRHRLKHSRSGWT